MHTGELAVDVCIIGGGPAGSSLARRLQRLGHSTIIIERFLFPRRHVGESLTASIFPLLELNGLSERVQSAGFLRPSGTFVRWAGRTEHRINAPGGMHVDRARFDQLLLDAAREAGSYVLQPARAVSLNGGDGHYAVCARTDAQEMTVRARVVSDASGRATFTKDARTRAPTRTIALYAYWRDFGLTASDTLVESSAHGWYWAAPLPHGEYVAAVFLDARNYRERLASLGGRTAVYEQLLNECTLFANCAGTRITKVFACDATPVQPRRPAQAGVVSVGDAAFAIDPLSSQGVEVAVGSALHAATMINTVLRRSYRTDLALEFYFRRIAESARLHAAAAEGYCRAAADFHGTAFWRDRAGLAPSLSDTVPRVPTNPESMLTTLRVAPEARIIPYSAVLGDEIVPADAVCGAGLASPVVFVGGVPMAPLLRLVQSPMSASEIYSAWTAHVPPFVAAQLLRWAILHSVLIDRC